MVRVQCLIKPCTTFEIWLIVNISYWQMIISTVNNSICTTYWIIWYHLANSSWQLLKRQYINHPLRYWTTKHVFYFNYRICKHTIQMALMLEIDLHCHTGHLNRSSLVNLWPRPIIFNVIPLRYSFYHLKIVWQTIERVRTYICDDLLKKISMLLPQY